MFQPILLGEIVLSAKSVFALEKVAGKGQNSTQTGFRGPKKPPEMEIERKTCSTICGTGHFYEIPSEMEVAPRLHC